MKKLFLVALLAIISIGAYAQKGQGNQQLGFNIGYAFDSENATLGVDYRYNITDAIRFAGVDATTPLLGGTQSMPYIIEDGVAKLADRSAFAGSIATTDALLQRSVQAGIAPPDVVKMMTQTPAEVMGLAAKGRIAPGYDAQFTVFDSNLHICQEFNDHY